MLHKLSLDDSKLFEVSQCERSIVATIVESQVKALQQEREMLVQEKYTLQAEIKELIQNLNSVAIQAKERDKDYEIAFAENSELLDENCQLKEEMSELCQYTD